MVLSSLRIDKNIKSVKVENIKVDGNKIMESWEQLGGQLLVKYMITYVINDRIISFVNVAIAFGGCGLVEEISGAEVERAVSSERNVTLAAGEPVSSLWHCVQDPLWVE